MADKPTVEEAPPEAPPEVLVAPSAKAASRPASSKEAPTEVTRTCEGSSGQLGCGVWWEC